MKNSEINVTCYTQEGKKNTYNILIMNPERKIVLGKVAVYWGKILKWNLLN
jgi:hypothetical protein